MAIFRSAVAVFGWPIRLKRIPEGVILQSVIRSFQESGTEDIFDGADTRAATKVCPRTLWPVA
jgi:hypothetical protein